MNLVRRNNSEELYLNMDFIECVSRDKSGTFRAWMNGSEDGYEISESAYNTILLYGKAKV